MDHSAAIAAWSAAFAAHGLGGATLARAASAAGTSIAELAGQLADPWRALDALLGSIDQAALASCRPAPGETPRERLFQLAMARFDAMRPHRAAIGRLLADARTRPGLALVLALALGRSAATLLGAADIATTGPAGIARTKALAAILADAGRTWLSDESEDLGATMAALDRRLGEAERWAQRMCGRSAEAADAASPAQYAATAQGGAADGEDGDMPDLPDIMVDGDDPAEPLIGDKRDAPTSGDGDGDRDNGTAGQRGRNEDPPARRRSRKG
jgi:hypothetical protein